ncbi:nicotinamide riboside transporter PnuC [Brevibacillus composti]|uniref:Nicotinamide mononucleotide transporter n=1 Tax=Brevibacillus composti TaxID=2796470 RepID=A0A7T5ENG3_9BACL|nr:nicotinamide riboside transporter PnuC [Brevibacillus composti]QQE75786.1 nicotinamide mononucleotide transporter [Brevibacillus composti]QUO42812.1 nicotinamide riboside transporter PnuC [Brevibacillus composti]
MFRDWTRFEKVWLLLFTIINIYLFYAFQDSLLGLISSLSGMLCVVLVAKGKIANYYFGIVQTATYAYISYSYSLYGEAMLNGLFYLPVQFIGLYMWSKNRTQQSVKGEDVSVKRLTKRGWVYLIIIAAVGIVLYAELLHYIGGQAVRLDSAAVVLSIIAQILMLKRYAEQWALWIAVNVLSISLWVVTLLTQGGNDFNMIVMWSAFLVNSIYGYYNWTKLSKAQEAYNL